jgi:chemotaxis signal transduction protein
VDEFRSGQYLTFRVGRKEFAIEAGPVKAVIPAHDLVTAENPEPEWLAGEARLRGETFPVVDLRARLKLRYGVTGRNPCIVVVHNGTLVGFLADCAAEIIHARAHDFRNGKIRIGRPRQVVNLSDLSVEEPALTP